MAAIEKVKVVVLGDSGNIKSTNSAVALLLLLHQ